MACIAYSARLLFVGALALFSNLAATASLEVPSLTILVYHQIRADANGPADGPTAISLDRFEAQMRYLHESGYTTLSTDEVVEFVAGRAKFQAKKIVAIHFDDGWKSAQLALPVLDRYGFKASFWIIPGTGIGWPHMDWEEVQTLEQNPRYEVFSHTMTHPWKDGDTLVDWVNGRTPGKGLAQARWELLESRRRLTERLHHPVFYLAWPSGLYDDALIGLATAAGYRALFTIDDGVNQRGGDLLRIRRTMIHGGCSDQVFMQTIADGRYRNCSSSANPDHK